MLLKKRRHHHHSPTVLLLQSSIFLPLLLWISSTKAHWQTNRVHQQLQWVFYQQFVFKNLLSIYSFFFLQKMGDTGKDRQCLGSISSTPNIPLPNQLGTQSNLFTWKVPSSQPTMVLFQILFFISLTLFSNFHSNFLVETSRSWERGQNAAWNISDEPNLWIFIRCRSNCFWDRYNGRYGEICRSNRGRRDGK